MNDDDRVLKAVREGAQFGFLLVLVVVAVTIILLFLTLKSCAAADLDLGIGQRNQQVQVVAMTNVTPHTGPYLGVEILGRQPGIHMGVNRLVTLGWQGTLDGDYGVKFIGGGGVNSNYFAHCYADECYRPHKLGTQAFVGLMYRDWFFKLTAYDYSQIAPKKKTWTGEVKHGGYTMATIGYRW